MFLYVNVLRMHSETPQCDVSTKKQAIVFRNSFLIDYKTLRGLELCISTLPARTTSKEIEPRTSGSFLPCTLCNLEEVGLCLTAGGSPKGNTCGLSRLPYLPSTSKGSNHTCPATFF